MDMSKILLILALGAWLPSAYGEDINFVFSGVLDTCDSDCLASELAALQGTGFSGTIRIPSSGADLDPVDPSRGLFEFGSPAQLSFESEMFTFLERNPVNVWVGNCIGLGCAPNQDFVFISLVDTDFTFTLAFSSIGSPQLATDEIPTVDVFTVMYAGFEILKNGFSTSIQTDSTAVESPLDIFVSAVPIPTPIWLLLSALSVVFRRGQNLRLTKCCT